MNRTADEPDPQKQEVVVFTTTLAESLKRLLRG